MRETEKERKKKVHYLQRQKESRGWKDPQIIPGSVRQEKKDLELSLGYRAKPYHKQNKDRQARETAQSKPCKSERA